MKRNILLLTLLAAACFLANRAVGQNSSLFHQDLPGDDRQTLKLSNCSWLFQKVDPPQHLKLHDLVTIIVKEGSNLTSQGEVDRRKTGKFDAQLKNWIRLDGLSIKSAKMANGDPEANGTLDSEYQAAMELQTKDSLSFTLTAEVVDVRPNGNLVVEAHHRVAVNEDVWEQSLSGVVRRDDVLPNNTVLSQNIAELSIDKREVGHVRDGYKRGWLTRFYDRFMVF